MRRTPTKPGRAPGIPSPAGRPRARSARHDSTRRKNSLARATDRPESMAGAESVRWTRSTKPGDPSTLKLDHFLDSGRFDLKQKWSRVDRGKTKAASRLRRGRKHHARRKADLDPELGGEGDVA